MLVVLKVPPTRGASRKVQGGVISSDSCTMVHRDTLMGHKSTGLFQITP